VPLKDVEWWPEEPPFQPDNMLRKYVFEVLISIIYLTKDHFFAFLTPVWKIIRPFLSVTLGIFWTFVLLVFFFFDDLGMREDVAECLASLTKCYAKYIKKNGTFAQFFLTLLFFQHHSFNYASDPGHTAGLKEFARQAFSCITDELCGEDEIRYYGCASTLWDVCNRKHSGRELRGLAEIGRNCGRRVGVESFQKN
jgi:hypothetical protein